jgi:hypothetical protein
MREDFVGRQRLISPDGEIETGCLTSSHPSGAAEGEAEQSTASCGVYLGSPIHASARRASWLGTRQPTFGAISS